MLVGAKIVGTIALAGATAVGIRLGCSNPATTPTDPITTDREVVEFLSAIEREIFQLIIEQAEIQIAQEHGVQQRSRWWSRMPPLRMPPIQFHPTELLHGTLERLRSLPRRYRRSNQEIGVPANHAEEGLEAVHDEEGKEVGTANKDSLEEENYEKNAEGVEVQNENEGSAGGQSGDAATKVERYNQSNNRRRTNCLTRPDAEDCANYLKFGSCKFGLNCKFNHPPRRKNQGVEERANRREENPETAGQKECKYYLSSEGCKYGKDCKFSHGSNNSSTSNIPEFNFLGLPIRPGKKECPHYMRTGSCKYGSNCRFHHPDPTPVVGDDSPSGYGNGGSLPVQFVSSSYVSSWSSPRAFDETSPFQSAMFPPTQGASTSNPEWNGYQAATCPTSERSLPTAPAPTINSLSTEINFPMQHQYNMVVEEYPERPGEPECSFVLKTGDCKFKSNCKNRHPKNRISKAKANSCTLNDKGLPLRPDQPICKQYHRYGICKNGPACEYDHPSNFLNLAASFDNSRFVDGPEMLRKGNESWL